VQPYGAVEGDIRYAFPREAGKATHDLVAQPCAGKLTARGKKTAELLCRGFAAGASAGGGEQRRSTARPMMTASSLKEEERSYGAKSQAPS